MGYLSEYFKQKKEKAKNLDSRKIPQAGTETQEFIKYSKEKRQSLRDVGFVRALYRSLKPSLSDVLEITKLAAGDDGGKFMDSVYQSSKLYSALKDDARKAGPDALKIVTDFENGEGRDLSQEQKNRKLVEILPKEVSDFGLARVIMMDWNKIDEVKCVEELEKRLPPEKLKEAEETLSKHRDIGELSKEETITYPYQEKAEELKKFAPEDPEKRAQYLHALDYAAKNITSTTEQVRSEYEDYERDVQSNESARNKKIVEENESKFEDGKYNNIFQEKPFGFNTIYTVAEDKKDAAKSVLDYQVKLSDKTKDAIHRIFDKFDEMGLIKAEEASIGAGEQGSKIYGQRILFNKRAALIQAMEAENPDPDQIIKASEEYESSKKDVQEIYRIAREGFPQDDSVFSGNVDCTRTQGLDWDLVSDVMTTAQINSLYILYNQCKVSGVSLDDYLKTPGKAIYEDVLQKVDKYSFESQTKGKPLDVCMDILLQKPINQPELGKKETASNMFTISTASYGFGRAMEPLYHLESNPEYKAQNTVYSNLVLNYKEKIAGYEELKFGIFTIGQASLPEQIENRDRIIENLIVVSDADRNLADLIGVPSTDKNGVAKPEFSLEEYKKTHPADYEGMLKRADTILQKCLKSSVKEGAPSELEVKAVIQSAFMKVLQEHPEDAAKPGYQEMLSKAGEYAKEIAAKEDLGIDERWKNYMESAQNTVKYTDPSVITSELSNNVNEANVGVRMGSTEYKTAMENVNMLDRMMKEMLEDKTIEGRMEKIDRIREQMNTIDANIDAYMVRSDKKKSLDAKAQRRKDTLLNVKNSLKDLRFAMDDKEIELNALEASNATKKMQSELTLIKGLNTLYETRATSDRNMSKISAQGCKTALETLNQLAEKSTGENGYNDKEMAGAKKCIAAMLLDEMLSEKGSEVKDRLDQKITEIKVNNRKKNLPDDERIKLNEKEITGLYKDQVNKIVEAKAFKDCFPEKMNAADFHKIMVDMATDKKTYKQFKENVSKQMAAEKAANANKVKANTAEKNKTTNKNNTAEGKKVGETAPKQVKGKF